MNATMESETMRSGIHPSRGAQFAPATILLVEDEPAVRQITREALEFGGYRVLEADGPVAAEQIAADRQTEIDVLLTDVVMPGMNGPELARQVQRSRPDMVPLFMTGYAECEVLRLATQGSPQKHIQKPFTVGGLLARVADALAARWNGRESSQPPQYPSP